MYTTETINFIATYWHAESRSPFGLCMHEHECSDTFQELSMLSDADQVQPDVILIASKCLMNFVNFCLDFWMCKDTMKSDSTG